MGGAWAFFTYFDKKKEEKPPSPVPPITTIVEQKGTGIASGRDTNVHGPVTFGLDQKGVGQELEDKLKPRDEKLDKILAQVARDKDVEIAPLRIILAKLGEAGVKYEDIPKRLDAKADELIKLRTENEMLRRGPPALAAIAEEVQALIDRGDFDAARDALERGREAARRLRIDASRYEATFLAQQARVDGLQLAYRPGFGANACNPIDFGGILAPIWS
ncbi:MAG: hypothetical protein ACREDT_14695 [Methylocella sp.]